MLYSSAVSVWFCFIDCTSRDIFLKFLAFLVLFVTVSEEFYKDFFCIPCLGDPKCLNPVTLRLRWSFAHFWGKHCFPSFYCLFFYFLFPWPFRTVGFLFKPIFVFTLCLWLPNVWVWRLQPQSLQPVLPCPVCFHSWLTMFLSVCGFISVVSAKTFVLFWMLSLLVVSQLLSYHGCSSSPLGGFCCRCACLHAPSIGSCLLGLNAR